MYYSQQYKQTFFNFYLAAPRPTLGHSQGDSLTNLMLIITAFCLFRPEGHQEPPNEIESLSLAERLAARLSTDSLQRTNNCLSTISFTKVNYDIVKIIKNLDLNKVHGHDMTIIRMLKIFESILMLIFKSCIESEIFSIKWKKANVVPVHKKILKKYKKTILWLCCCLFVARY